MKINLLFTGLFLSFGLVGCNLLPTINASGGSSILNTSANYPEIDEMCKVASKNEVRATEKYKGTIISVRGKFNLRNSTGPEKYIPYVKITTQNFDVSIRINKTKKEWINYDEDQIINSGPQKVVSVSADEYGILNNTKPHCGIWAN